MKSLVCFQTLQIYRLKENSLQNTMIQSGRQISVPMPLYARLNLGKLNSEQEIPTV